MRLAALVESPDHVCTRYRLRAFEPTLKAAGRSIDYFTLPRTAWGRLTIGAGLAEYDAVLLQRKLVSRIELSLIRRQAKTMWFDMDDAVWMRDSFSGKGFESGKRKRRFDAIMRAADGVICGNRFLAESAERSGAKRAWIVPTCVDVERYPIAGHRSDTPSLVWVGSSSTLQGLQAIAPILEHVGEQNPGLRLKMICDRFFPLKNLSVIETPWSEATEAIDIASAEIGISWIPDDPWSRGKCGLKLLQYMAAGLPVVTNPAGVHPEMVEHGVNGYLANTPDEWANAIGALARDPELRRKMGAAGRHIAKERYSVEAGGEVWLRILVGPRSA